MAALTAPRQISQTNGDALDAVGLDTNVIVYHGATMAKVATGGYAHPATATAGDEVIGIADLIENANVAVASGQAPITPDVSGTKVDMTSVAAGSKQIQIRRGIFERENKTGDLVTNEHIGLDVYVEDDHTVRATGTASIVAGKLFGFHPRSGKPMVELGVAGRGL